MADFIGLGMQVVGGVINAYGTLQEGEQANELSKISQQQYEQEAKAIGESGRQDVLQLAAESERTKASQIATIMANGGKLTGTSSMLVEETAKNYMRDRLIMTHNYQVQQIGMRNQGAMIRYQGKLARRNSRIRALAGVFTGMSQMSQTMSWPSPATTKTTGVSPMSSPNNDLWPSKGMAVGFG